MNGKTLIAGASGVAAIAFTLVLTTSNLRADPTVPYDESQALRNRVSTLEAEVKALKSEIEQLKSQRLMPFGDFKSHSDFSGKVKINGKEYILPRDKEKLEKDMPNFKFGEGLFNFEKDGERLKFDLPEIKFEGKGGKVYILPRDIEKLEKDPNFKLDGLELGPGEHRMEFDMSRAEEAIREAMKNLRKSLKDAPSEVQPSSV